MFKKFKKVLLFFKDYNDIEPADISFILNNMESKVYLKFNIMNML